MKRMTVPNGTEYFVVPYKLMDDKIVYRWMRQKPSQKEEYYTDVMYASKERAIKRLEDHVAIISLQSKV